MEKLQALLSERFRSFSDTSLLDTGTPLPMSTAS